MTSFDKFLSSDDSSKLKRMVEILPEIYQPIYGYPDLTNDASRECDDRLKEIVKIYNNLQAKLGRPLKVLDLGCAQGYFCFKLAYIGATVHGVDFLNKNIELCKYISSLNSNLNVSFSCEDIECFIKNMRNKKYDLVIGLSVFHHLSHKIGKLQTKKLVNLLAMKTGLSLIEVALAKEPLYWGKSQFDDPRELLSDIPFVRKIKSFTTHLSKIKRPLFICSSKFWSLGNIIGCFDNWSQLSHQFDHHIHQKTRRYFFSKNIVIKHYLFSKNDMGRLNKNVYLREIEAYKNIPLGINVPKLKFYYSNEQEGWVMLDRIPGEMLSSLMVKNKISDASLVIKKVLKQLIVLENSGLYFNDLRHWNLIQSPGDDIFFIDIASLSTNPVDCAYPKNIYVSFLIFVQELLNNEICQFGESRNGLIASFTLPDFYENWFSEILNLKVNKISFKLILKLFDSKEKTHKKIVRSNTLKSLYLKDLHETKEYQNILINKKIDEQVKIRLKLQITDKIKCIDDLNLQINDIYNSKAWKLITQLRKLLKIFKK